MFRLVAICAVLALGLAAKSEVKELTDSNFEHDTQASTGMTTGPWFVEFYAPWCGHCKKLAPVWEDVAQTLKGRINVAKLDATANPATSSRFGIKGLPTIKLLKDGKMYTYAGGRSHDELADFASRGYASVTPEEIPGPPTLLDQALALLETLGQDIEGIVRGQTAAFVIILATGFVLGLLGGLLLAPKPYYDAPLPQPPHPTHTTPAAAEGDADSEKKKDK